MQLSNKTYDFVKHLVQVVLPAIAALYFGLSQFWGLPNAENVVGTIALVATFLGVTLGISSHNYSPPTSTVYAGEMVIDVAEDGKRVLTLELDEDPHALVEAKDVVFKVVDRS